MKAKMLVMTFLLLAAGLCAQDLTITAGDLRIEQRVEGGFHLFIRKKPGVASVLLTESTRDPARIADNYAYRAREWNAVNGNEIRLLNGSPLRMESGIFSLIDSTPEADAEFGEAFHIYIPYILEYGYSWTRYGEVYISDGTFLNIRAFALPYGDYSGAFRDNPYTVETTQAPLEGKPEGNFMKDTVEAFTEISAGNISWSTGGDDVVPKIESVLAGGKGKTVDLVLCLDATGSMKNDIDSVRKMLIPMLEDVIGGFTDFRIGMVLYKDYRDEYLTKVVPFTRSFADFQRNLNAIRVAGGGDIPEAVYEALHDAAGKFTWEAEEKIVILIGDAPPHLKPKGKITKETVSYRVTEEGLKVNAIILPQ